MYGKHINPSWALQLRADALAIALGSYPYRNAASQPVRLGTPSLDEGLGCSESVVAAQGAASPLVCLGYMLALPASRALGIFIEWHNRSIARYNHAFMIMPANSISITARLSC